MKATVKALVVTTLAVSTYLSLAYLGNFGRLKTAGAISNIPRPTTVSEQQRNNLK